jgi:hypothetical protein
MTSITKVIGWLVLVITEILIVIAFFSGADKVALVGYQVGIFVTVWGAVGVKNFIDLKKDQIPGCSEVQPNE